MSALRLVASQVSVTLKQHHLVGVDVTDKEVIDLAPVSDPALIDYRCREDHVLLIASDSFGFQRSLDDGATMPLSSPHASTRRSTSESSDALSPLALDP